MRACLPAICYEQIARKSMEHQIPYLDAKRVADVPVPWPPPAVRRHIGPGSLNWPWSYRDQAFSLRECAIRHVVEQAIEEAA